MTVPQPPDVYGEPVIYVCRCHTAHGVIHICALCRDTRPSIPTEPWVPLERCYTCLADQEERVEAELAVIRRKLRKATHAVDGVTGERIPPLFLTTQGWQR